MDPNFSGLSGAGAPQQQQGPPSLSIAGMQVPQGYSVPPTYLQQFAAAQAQQEHLRRFWADVREETLRTGTDPIEFKTQQLPLARIKKIMKSDEDVRMISAEAPVLFAKACEFFILEITLRAWHAAEETKRRTLQRSDIATAIARTDIFDFLVDIVPREEANPPPTSTPPTGVPGSAPLSAPPMPLYPGMNNPQYMAGPGGMPLSTPGMLGPQGAAGASSSMQLPNGAAGMGPGGPSMGMGMYGGGGGGMGMAPPPGYGLPPGFTMPSSAMMPAQQMQQGAVAQQPLQQQAQQQQADGGVATSAGG